MAFLRLILMSLLALRLLGGDLAVLQVLAWGGMIVSRTAEQGVAAAVESTLDGEHPCPMCKALKTVREAETGEKKPAAPETSTAKLKLKDLLWMEDLPMAPPQWAEAGKNPPLPWQNPAATARTDAPPVPPPRQMARLA